MDYERFFTIVEQSAGIGREQAERAVQATLQTLAERIAAGEARDIAAQLPPELAPWLSTTGGAVPFDIDEFLRRVAEREGVDLEAAQRHARAIFDALARALTPRELADMSAQLSKDFAPLLPTGLQVEVLDADEIVLRVAERAGVDPDRAGTATEAVLETLAERIAGGEVEDLKDRLPVELHPPLDRGVQRSGGRATRMPFDEFLRRVAERAGVPLDQAQEEARAVLATLREAVGERELFDVLNQLPQEYAPILPALAR